ncbi:MAG: class I SAM-dependent methyltransferase [Acidobacteriota bacterium]
MTDRVCPWWIGYFLLCPFRRWSQDPISILSPYVHEGITALEPGPGMGFFTIPLARLVGASGRVYAVDLQPQMIAALKRRAARAHVLERIDARIVPADTMALNDLTDKIDFTLAFAVVHEFPDPLRFFSEAAKVCKPHASLLLAEPRGHVSTAKFQAELTAAKAAGFKVAAQPEIPRSHAALLMKDEK